MAKRGDVKLVSLGLLENSNVFTGGGNVNVSIAQRFKSGEPALNIKSKQGNITVK